MTWRIALLGANTKLKTWVADMLRSGDFVVDCCDPQETPSLFDGRLRAYHLVIASADLASRLEEDTAFNSSLDAQGFLIFDDRAKTEGREPSFLIHTGMCPEDVLAKINAVLFLNSSLRKTHRQKCKQPVEYEYEGAHHYSVLQEISEYGGFIITLAPPPKGALITLRVTMPGGRDLVARGRAIYSITCNLDQRIISHPSSHDKRIIALPGFGVTFEDMPDEDRATIRAFIKTPR